MRRQQFIDAVYDAGWRPSLDAQHSEITKVWAKCFPTAASLEDEYNDMTELAMSRAERIDQLERERDELLAQDQEA